MVQWAFGIENNVMNRLPPKGRTRIEYTQHIFANERKKTNAELAKFQNNAIFCDGPMHRNIYFIHLEQRQHQQPHTQTGTNSSQYHAYT